MTCASRDDWWDASYHQRVLLSLPVPPAETLDDFPVLIQLTPTNFKYAQSSTTGADLRFIGADGKPLSYEIERWSPGGNSYVWVRLPELNSGMGGTQLWLYYANSSAGSAEASKDVWGPQFVSVYHFSRRQGDAEGSYRDSAGLYPGTLTGKPVDAPATGKSADGFDCHAARFVDLGGESHELDADPGDARTVEIWFNVSDAQPPHWQMIASQEGCDRGWGMAVDEQGHLFGRYFTNNTCVAASQDYHAVFLPEPSVSDGQWHHVALVVDRPASKLSLYLDGTPRGDTPINNDQGGDSIIHRIGTDWDNTSPFHGTIDEFRVAKTALSPAWIAATVASMGAGYVTFGAAESCR